MSVQQNTIAKNKVSNDPISDFLTRIRNSITVRKASVLIPFSKLKLSLAELMQREGYIKSFTVVNDEDPSTKSIQIELKYVKGQSVIKGLKRVSKPGLRKYVKSKYVPRVLNGLGVCVLSTNQGLISDRKARAEKVGGEILCTIW